MMKSSNYFFYAIAFITHSLDHSIKPSFMKFGFFWNIFLDIYD